MSRDNREEGKDTAELRKFREKWKQEISSKPSKKEKLSSPTSSSSSSATTTISSSLPFHSPFNPLDVSSHTSSRFMQTKKLYNDHEENHFITLFTEKLLLQHEEEKEQEQENDKEKEKEKEVMRIKNLPNELVIQVMSFLDVKSLERCSGSCRLWYILARLVVVFFFCLFVYVCC
jgi:hypothetical protein